MSASAFKIIYHACFHSPMSYGIIFRRNLLHSSTIFSIQKEAIRIMEVYGNRVSCRNLFKKLKILAMTSQNLLYLVMFVVQNKNLFSMNIKNHHIDTRQRNNLYLPQANLTIYQKGAYYSGIKTFNNFSMDIKNVADNIKKFQIALIQFLYTDSYYTLEEYFNQSRIMYYITKIAYYIGISCEVLCYGTLYKSFIDCLL